MQEKPRQIHPAGPIAAVEVANLFGKFDYRIDLFERPVANPRSSRLFAASEDRLTLVYGKNGSGKTTLLRLLFHALSAASDRGHRHALSRAPFSLLRVEFSDGSRVEYLKDEALGEDVMLSTVELAGNPVAEWRFLPTRARREIFVTSDADVIFEEDSGEREFLAALESLAVNPVFLADTRVLEADLTAVERQRPREIITSRGGLQVDQLVEQQRDQDLAEALERVRRYLTQLVYTGAQRGSQRVDTIYTTLVKTLAEHEFVRGRPRKATIPNLIERVQKVGERAAAFTRFGLLPRPPVSALVKSLEKAQMRNGPLLEQVLTPYLDSVEQRMAELDPGLHAIASYVDTLNSFFEGKSLNFRTPGGVDVTDDVIGERLKPSDLSSGEKQILLLFSDVVALRETARLFIIDEPELSLNPNWQRMMIPALLDSTRASPMQIVAATHSIEMMSKYRSRLKALEEADDEAATSNLD